MEEDEVKKQGQQQQSESESPLQGGSSAIGKTTNVIKKTAQTATRIGAIGTAATETTEGAAAATATIAASEIASETAAAVPTAVGGIGILGWSALGTVILIVVLTIIIAIIGGSSSINIPNAIQQNPPPEIPNNGKPLPSILNFNGGYAYLSCDSTTRKNCPVFDNKTGNLNITVYGLVYIDKTKIKFDPNKAWVYITINTAVFSSLTKNSTTPPYDSLTGTGVLSARNKFKYGWKLSTLLKSDVNSHIISISDKIAPGIRNGSTTISLTLSGVGTVTASETTDTAQGDLYAGMDSAPSDKTCNQYGGIMNIIEVDTKIPPFKSQLKPANYGDPQCTYTPKKFKQVVADTLNKPVTDSMVDFWSDLADCESKSPNGHDPGDHNTKGNCAALGTWGRFQMCSNNPPGQPWKKLSYRGDVTWQRQIQNAIWANKQQDDSFVYWGTARCMCGTKKYKDQPVCAKLWSKQRACERTNNPSSCDYIRYNCNNSCAAIGG